MATHGYPDWQRLTDNAEVELFGQGPTVIGAGQSQAAVNAQDVRNFYGMRITAQVTAGWCQIQIQWETGSVGPQPNVNYELAPNQVLDVIVPHRGGNVSVVLNETTLANPTTVSLSVLLTNREAVPGWDSDDGIVFVSEAAINNAATVNLFPPVLYPGVVDIFYQMLNQPYLILLEAFTGNAHKAYMFQNGAVANTNGNQATVGLPRIPTRFRISNNSGANSTYRLAVVGRHQQGG